MGSAMAVGLNVASQNKDWQKDKNPCLPINGMGLNLRAVMRTSVLAQYHLLARGDQEMGMSKTKRNNAT